VASWALVPFLLVLPRPPLPRERVIQSRVWWRAIQRRLSTDRLGELIALRYVQRAGFLLGRARRTLLQGLKFGQRADTRRACVAERDRRDGLRKEPAFCLQPLPEAEIGASGRSPGVAHQFCELAGLVLSRGKRWVLFQVLDDAHRSARRARFQNDLL